MIFSVLFRLLRKPAGQALRLPLRAVSAACADEVACRHNPSHVDRLGGEDHAAAAGEWCWLVRETLMSFSLYLLLLIGCVLIIVLFVHI